MSLLSPKSSAQVRVSLLDHGWGQVATSLPQQPEYRPHLPRSAIIPASPCLWGIKLPYECFSRSGGKHLGLCVGGSWAGGGDGARRHSRPTRRGAWEQKAGVSWRASPAEAPGLAPAPTEGAVACMAPGAPAAQILCPGILHPQCMKAGTAPGGSVWPGVLSSWWHCSSLPLVPWRCSLLWATPCLSFPRGFPSSLLLTLLAPLRNPSVPLPLRRAIKRSIILFILACLLASPLL